MDDATLNGLNVLEEAGGEIDDGKAAIARVVKNRMVRHYFSNGTVPGTVLYPNQFSWAYFAFVTRHTGTGVHDHSVQSYVRIASTSRDAMAVAEGLRAKANADQLAHCTTVAEAVMAGEYSGLAYDKLTDDALLYLNPRILTKPPKWAIPSKLICSIGRHDFYRG